MTTLKLDKIYKKYPNATHYSVEDFSIDIKDKEFIVFVGPSGCGKSTTLRMVAGLEEITEGKLYIDGEVVNDKSPKDRDIAMVFQNYALYPHMTVYENMAFGLKLRKYKKDDIDKRVREAAASLGLTEFLDRKPADLSGGQRQRVVIAMALTREPKLLIADEPTTALDVTVQAEVVKLLNELREKLGFAMVFVSHDLALVAQLAHHITVMYAGQVVEMAPTSLLLANPTHEYTRGLLGSVLSTEVRAKRLYQIPGSVPSPYDFATGDRFASRSLRPDANPDQKLILTAVEGEPSHLWASHLAEPVTEAKGA